MYNNIQTNYELTNSIAQLVATCNSIKPRIFNITVEKTAITSPNRVHDWYADITVSDGIHDAMFITHGETVLEIERFSSGHAANGVELHCRHKDNFDADFEFRPGRYARVRNYDLECIDLMAFIYSCEGLPIRYPQKEGIKQYRVENGKVKHNKKPVNKQKVYEHTEQLIKNYETAKIVDVPDYYKERLQNKVNQAFSEMERENIDDGFDIYFMRHKKAEKEREDRIASMYSRYLNI